MENRRTSKYRKTLLYSRRYTFVLRRNRNSINLHNIVAIPMSLNTTRDLYFTTVSG